jgi:hypothetical protein
LASSGSLRLPTVAQRTLECNSANATESHNRRGVDQAKANDLFDREHAENDAEDSEEERDTVKGDDRGLHSSKRSLREVVDVIRVGLRHRDARELPSQDGERRVHDGESENDEPGDDKVCFAVLPEEKDDHDEEIANQQTAAVPEEYHRRIEVPR